MVQNLKEVKSTDYIDDGLIDLLERDLSALTLMSGDSFPNDETEDLFYNDMKNKIFYQQNDGVWEKVIEYNSGKENVKNLERKYQPLNRNLTKYSSASINNQGFVVNGNLYPVTNYFKQTLMTCPSYDSLFKGLGLGSISKLNGISNVYIKDYSITPEKLSNTLVSTPVFKSGDICTSFNKNGKNGFLKLANNISVGNYSSGATYSGVQFKDLFKELWKRSDLQLLNVRGAVVKKSNNSDTDWNTNCRMMLPNSPNVFQTSVGKVLFESSKPETTYTFNVTIPGYYHVTIVGGGGGSVAYSRNYAKWWNAGAAGGSGAGFVGYIYFPVGTYNVKIGAAGVSYATSADGFSKATNGGDSVISGVITAGGGGAGVGADGRYCWTNGLGYTKGSGGKLTINNVNRIYSSTIRSNGKDGSGAGWGEHAWNDFSGGDSVVQSLGLDYGKGGDTSYGSNRRVVTEPKNGYVKIVYGGYYEPLNDNQSNVINEKFFKDVTFYIKI